MPCVPKIMAGIPKIRLLEWNTTDIWNWWTWGLWWGETEGGYAVAPAHYANIVGEFLDVTFTLRWIGRSGWKNGPHALQTSYSWKFISVGYVKQSMYSVRIHNIQRFKQPINETAVSVTLMFLVECRISLRRLQGYQWSLHRILVNTWSKTIWVAL
jgi:hypothetical protein